MKPFDQSLYDEFDNAKLIMLAWCNKHLGKSFINPDVYGPDLITAVGYVEVEVRNTWTGDKWPYPSVQLPIRKRKWLNDREAFWFAIMNRERTRAMIINGKTALEAPIINKSNRYAAGEMFMNIRTQGLIIDTSEFATTIDDTWERLKPSPETGL